jgi:hypothetical protein
MLAWSASPSGPAGPSEGLQFRFRPRAGRATESLRIEPAQTGPTSARPCQPDAEKKEVQEGCIRGATSRLFDASMTTDGA